MTILRIIIVLGLVTTAPFSTFAEVNIFACEPEWESLAKEIGKENVKVRAATNAFTDPHHIRARPSLIAAMRRSDLVICSGSDLEVGWLPILLERAKASVQPGQVGYLMASDYVPRLEVPKILDRSMGDVHPGGNPHVHLNPHNITKIVKELTKRLQQLDADNSKYYRQNMDAFITRWNSAIKRWEKRAQPLKNVSIIVQHSSWVYLVDWLELNQVATLEPKPGIPPTVSHLESVLAKMKKKPVKLIIHAVFEDGRSSKWLSEKTNIPMAVLPFTVGGNKKSGNFEALFDDTITRLLEVK